MDQPVSTLKYGDVVLYEVNGERINAQVLQSQIVPAPDRKAHAGMTHEEHLTIVYLKPGFGKPIMSQTEMDTATGRHYGVAPWSATNRNGWIRCQQPGQMDAPPQAPENPEEAAEAAAQKEELQHQS